MFSAALIDPLPPRHREFLAVMGLADEFTVDMAREITGYDDAEDILAALTGQNAFVTRLPDGCAFLPCPRGGSGTITAATAGGMRPGGNISTPWPPITGAGTTTPCCG